MAPSSSTTASRLVGLVDRHKAEHPEMRDAAIARRLGMTPANLSLWRSKGVRGWPARATLDALAELLDCPYRVVLDAALADAGYAPPASSVPRSYGEVLADAIAALTEATRLTNFAVRQSPSGGWEADPNTPVAIDWAEFVCHALAAAAANAGGVEAVLAGRPGSWEAGVIRDALTATVGADEHELWRHRTEPLKVVIDPEQVLYDAGSRYFDQYAEADRELDRRSNAIRPSQVYSRPGHELDERMRAYYADLGVEVIEGPPPSLNLPTAEEVEALLAAERENPTELSADEQAEEHALAAIENLRERVEDLQRAELADYGVRLADGIRERMAAFNLPVPVHVAVADDDSSELMFGVNYPGTDGAGGIFDGMITDVLANTPRPDALPGTLLTRAEHGR